MKLLSHKCMRIVKGTFTIGNCIIISYRSDANLKMPDDYTTLSPRDTE